MTLHITAIHSADHFRSDVRAGRSRIAKLTEELRAEIERDRPLLHWPLRNGAKNTAPERPPP